MDRIHDREGWKVNEFGFRTLAGIAERNRVGYKLESRLGQSRGTSQTSVEW